jgi:hypothetical protein
VVDVETLNEDVKSLKADVKNISEKTTANAISYAQLAASYAALKTLNDILPMLIKWVFFPLVSILGAGFGINIVLQKVVGG